MVIRTLCCCVYLIISCIKTQRVTIISSPLTDNYIDWHYQGSSASGGIQTNFRCPEPTCFQINQGEHLYRYVNTTGYNSIQIGYDIRPKGIDGGESCTFSWVIGTYLPSEGSWTLQEKHRALSTLNILHSSLPSGLDNVASLGIDFLADVNAATEHCLINNVLVTGIPITQSPSLFPTHNPTLSPTNNPTRQPTRDPSLVPTWYPTLVPTLYPSKPPTLVPTLYPSIPSTMIPTRQPTRDPSSMNPSTTPSFNPVNSLNPTFNPSTNPVKTDTTQSVITTDYDEVTRKDGYVETDPPEEHDQRGQAGQPVGAYEVLNSVLIVMAIIICCMCGCFLYLTFRYQEKKGMVDAHIAISEARLAMGSIADDDRPNAMQQKANPNAAAPAADPMQNNNAFGAMYGGMAASDSMWR
eukprot:92238_1